MAANIYGWARLKPRACNYACVPRVGCTGPSTQTNIHYFPKELDWKHNSQILNQISNTECQHHRQQLNILCHNASPPQWLPHLPSPIVLLRQVLLSPFSFNFKAEPYPTHFPPKSHHLEPPSQVFWISALVSQWVYLTKSPCS